MKDIYKLDKTNNLHNIFLNTSLPLNIQDVTYLDECKKYICDLTFYYNDTKLDIIKNNNNLEIHFDDLSIKTKSIDNYINDIFNYLDIDINTKYKSEESEE